MVSCRVCPRDPAFCRDFRHEADSCGQFRQEAIFLQTVVHAGRKRSRTVSAEDKYDEQSRQEVKLGGLVYTLCTISDFNHKSNIDRLYGFDNKQTINCYSCKNIRNDMDIFI